MDKYKHLRDLVPPPSGNGPDWPILLAAVPELLLLATTPQDSQYHGEGDVLTHTKLVCEALLTLPDYLQADEDRRFVLFYAALLHDIAKPSCTILQANSRITSAGHSRRGAVDVRVLLWRAGVPFGLRETICSIILNHQIPFYALKDNRAGETPEFLIRKLSWELPLVELAAVAEADMRGRICKTAADSLDDIELFRELARDENCYTTPYDFPDAHTRLSYFRSGGAIAPDYPFFQEPGSHVLVMSGLPASGKDTWVAAHAGNLSVISFDDAREELGLKHGPGAGAAVHLATDRAKELLRQKLPFVWNATHLSGLMRKKTLDLLYAYGAEVEMIYLEAPEPVIKSRNARRDNTLTNAGIDKMLHRWELPLPTEVHVIRYWSDGCYVMPRSFEPSSPVGEVSPRS